ncbi:GTPase IMAP family member 7-like isoform X3 [Biomphalaria glabrata]|uniref:GTPase IMAP family member 7-like isoform X3 n=1 Tax=Biomphalaria glabrata TaxID=6526 RepID=A0A9W3BC56_BIOGL|nr:GTPase IMAP family member 7-like isoform X3 [Biomphalaria glabrata]
MSSLTNKDIAVILLGKTGYGKSTTGNTILDSDKFEVGVTHTTASITKLIDHGTSIINGCKWTVYDTPGLVDVEKSELESIQNAVDDMSRLMIACHERKQINIVFILVYDIINKFSKEDKKTFDALESLFGNKNFWKRCVLVLTKLDVLDTPFDEWLSKQTGFFNELVEKCGNNVVPVCNKETKEEQKTLKRSSREKLLKVILELGSSEPSYTFDEFKSFEKLRKDVILQYELPSLETKYNEKINRIKEERLKVRSKSQREAVLQKIAILKDRIVDKDNGTGRLRTYIESLDYEIESIPNPRCVIL